MKLEKTYKETLDTLRKAEHEATCCNTSEKSYYALKIHELKQELEELEQLM